MLTGSNLGVLLKEGGNRADCGVHQVWPANKREEHQSAEQEAENLPKYARGHHKRDGNVERVRNSLQAAGQRLNGYIQCHILIQDNDFSKLELEFLLIVEKISQATSCCGSCLTLETNNLHA